MKTLKFLLIITSLAAITSCVSKKKYEDLAAAKKRTDLKLSEVTKENRSLETKLGSKAKEANKLNDELESLKAEFNNIKNEMLENNARKSSLIEDLNRKLALLSNDHKSATDSLKSMLNRLDTRDKKSKERAQNLSSKLADLEGIDKALEAHAENVQAIEKFITHNFDKNNISTAYTMIDGGFLYVTFDPNTLFKKGTLELEAEGKRMLKIIASALENNQPNNCVVASNWKEGYTNSWASTSEKANVVFTYLLENATLSETSLNISNDKVEEQKMGENDHQISLILFPPIKDIVKFAN